MNVKMVLFFILIFGGDVFSATAEKVFVKYVRGNVTILAPGHLKASVVKKNDWLLEGSSLVTGERSLVRLIFKDKSSMNIGPGSKIVLNRLPKNQANVVNLLTGMIKAKVQKKEELDETGKPKTKMLIQTRTAVMGVRGTKFQTTYNIANKSTSLVTVEGNVAMVKVAKPVAKNMASADVMTTKVESVEELETLVNTSPDVVEVPAGRYSGVIEKIAKPTVPVKISPTQYNVLAKSMGSKNKAKDVMQVTDADPDPKGFEDLQAGKLAPKAGGILDFSTGIYVPPEDSAKFDDTTGTYKARNIGKINSRTGDYVPPKGIRIDEKKGFVIDLKEGEKLASKNLKNKMANLNKSVEKTMVADSTNSKKINEIKLDTKEEKTRSAWMPDKNILSFSFLPYAETMKVKVKNKFPGMLKDEFYFESQQAHWLLLNWKQVWNPKWSSFIIMGDHKYKVADSSDTRIYQFGGQDDGDGPGYFSLGLLYQYSSQWEFSAALVNQSVYYVVPRENFFGSFPPPSTSNNEDEAELRDSDFGSLDIGASYLFKQWEKFNLVFGAKLNLAGGHKIPAYTGPAGMNMDPVSEEEAKMFGMELKASSLYQFNKKIMLRSDLRFDTHSAVSSSIEYERRSFGFGLELIWSI